jgi:hypothetical protein
MKDRDEDSDQDVSTKTASKETDQIITESPK